MNENEEFEHVNQEDSSDVMEKEYVDEKEQLEEDFFEQKITVAKTAFIALLGAFLSSVVTAGIVFALYVPIHPEMLVNDEQLSTSQLSQIEAVYYHLKNSFVDKEITSEQLIEGALKGMAEAVGDPYTQVMINEERQQIDDTLKGSFGGIGAELKTENGQVLISSTIDGMPAQKVGLQPNDIIIKVDNQDMAGKTISEVVAVVRGEAGTEVKLTILRGLQEIEVPVVRAEIPITTVRAKIEPNTTVGHIKISSFGRNTAKEVKESVEKLRNEGANSFVFDVRYNPGGLLDQAIIISNMFLKDGDKIVQVEERNGEIDTIYASEKDYGSFKIHEPYVLLINEESASASEILAGALKESGNAKILGTKSFGKGTVQTVVDISDTTELKFTNAKWLTPSGTWIHKEGIAPTQEVKLPDYAYLRIIDTREVEKQGNVSDNVKTIESILSALEYDVVVDGFYDDKTQAAVIAFQTSHQLPITGEVDKDTAQLLMKLLTDLIEQHDTPYQEAIKVLGLE